MIRELTLHVPATTANLGAGFDALGLCLQVYNTVRARPSDRWLVTSTGDGAEQLPTDAQNLVVRAAIHTAKRRGRELPPLDIACELAIPPARGLGSSASAVVAGVLLGELFTGGSGDRVALLERATELEGHPDNAAPALLGGLQVSVLQPGGAVASVRVPVATFPSVVLFIPAFRMETKAARAVLPETVSRATAVFNLSRSALLVGALAAGRWELLDVATQDALHQGPRTSIFPALPSLLDAARGAGARGQWLSGAGSTVAAFAPPEHASAVADALEQTARGLGVKGEARVTSVDLEGARWTLTL